METHLTNVAIQKKVGGRFHVYRGFIIRYYILFQAAGYDEETGGVFRIVLL